MSDRPDKYPELTQWFLEANQGSGSSYHKFLVQLTPVLRRVVARKINPNNSEDVVQEILISIHKARHTFDVGRAVMPWVLAIAHFRIHDALRKHYAVDQNLETFEENLFEDVTQNLFENESIDELLQGATQREAQILTLMHVDGFTAKEIAHKLELSESAIKVAAHRAIKKLRSNKPVKQNQR